MLECNKNFKSHHFKVGQLVTVKNNLKSTFDPKFISGHIILNIINECTLLIQSPDGKTRKININPYHTEGYSWLVSTSAKCDYSHNCSKCSSMPSGAIILY